jgi:hypothetical protein
MTDAPVKGRPKATKDKTAPVSDFDKPEADKPAPVKG